MLKFYSITIFCSVILVALLTMNFYYKVEIHWFLYCIPFLLHVLIIFYGSYFVYSNFFMEVLCKGDVQKKELVLTFDDGPHPEFTPKVLAILEEYQVKATFFCIGKNIEKYPELTQEIDIKGHIIGNHTYNHSNFFDIYTQKRVKQELKSTEEIIQEVIQKKTMIFRPPYGVTNPPIAKAVKALDYLTIGWSIRSLDTAIKEKEKIVSRVISQLKGGDILLLHDTSERTVFVLEEVLKHCKNNGIKIVGLDELLKIKIYEKG